MIWTLVKRQNSVVKRHFWSDPKLFWTYTRRIFLKKEIWRYFKWPELLCIPNMSGLRMNFWIVWNLGDLYFRNSWWFFFSNLGRLFLALKKYNLTSLHCPLQILDCPCKKNKLGWYYIGIAKKKKKKIIHTVSDSM